LFRRGIPLAISIATVFSAVLFSILAAFLWFWAAEADRMVSLAANREFSDAAARALERTERTLRPAQTLVTAFAGMPISGGVRDGNDPTNFPAAPAMREALMHHSQLLQAYVGSEKGDFRRVMRLDSAAAAQAVKAPAGALFAYQSITHDATGGKKETWAFEDKDGKRVGSYEANGNPFSPASRPWFQQARTAGSTIVTAPYVFFSTKQLGVTVARPMAGEAGAVVGIDVTLADWSLDLERARRATQMESLRLAVVDGAGQAFAYSDPARYNAALAEAGGKALPRAAQLSKLLADGYAAASDQQSTQVFSFENHDYMALKLKLERDLGGAVYVVLVADREELGREIERVRDRSVLLMLVGALLALPLIVLAGRWVAKPLRQLAVDATGIARLEPPQPRPPARVAEVRALQDAVDAAKGAVSGFGKFVPRRVVRDILAQKMTPTLGGERRVVTLLFTDIADFTAIAEGMTPEATMAKISAYLTELTGVLIEYGATIDKYIGDAVMAFWNAPDTQDNHVLRAAEGVLAARAKLDELNARWAAAGETPLQTRFGLHMGEVIVGNMGSAERMSYTAVGSSVNLASRLEGVNKVYGTTVMVSEPVAAALGERCLMRYVDRIRAKGTAEPVSIYELVALRDGAPEGDTLKCDRWEAARALYDVRDWKSADGSLARFAKQYPEDKLASVILDRAQLFHAFPPPDDWDGVHDLASK
jgi:adenylate cyclase